MSCFSSPCYPASAKRESRCAAVLLERLAALGLERVYRVALTSRDDDLQVVRVIVPGAELYSSDIPRVGVRLRDHAQAS